MTGPCGYRGHRATVAEMREMLKSFMWNDDGENHATVNMKIVSEDGSEEANISVTKHY